MENVASVMFVSKLKMEIWIGSKCHKQKMNNLTSKLSLLSSWRITLMVLKLISSCRLSNWHISACILTNVLGRQAIKVNNIL